MIGLERDYVHDDEIHVEWQLREIRSTFHRLPPKDDSYRSPHWEPCLPVDLPPFLADLLARQVKAQPRQRCACVAQHGGSGHYVFLGPDGGHPRRSNYARRVFRPACDGRYQPQPAKPPRLTIVDASAWPGIPITTGAPAPPGDTPYTRPRGRGIRPIPEDIPVACWLPVKQGLNPHGMRHGLSEADTGSALTHVRDIRPKFPQDYGDPREPEMFGGGGAPWALDHELAERLWDLAAELAGRPGRNCPPRVTLSPRSPARWHR